MSQRDSGYARKERDLYETPYWVTEALFPHLPRKPSLIWEPACGTGMMMDVLMSVATVHGSDIDSGEDFLAPLIQTMPDADAIITNPPYNQAQRFIEMALEIMEPRGGYVAMLLRTDYDHAKTRSHLFRDCPAFAKKVVLTKRIVWFEGGKSPSFNHAWFIWDWQHEGPPTIGYGP
jgi:hypothetical protein